MRIPVLAASFHGPIFIDGMTRTRIIAGAAIECSAARMEYDTKMGLVIIWPKRTRGVRSASGKIEGTIGAMMALPASMDVSEEFIKLLEEEKSVKPGLK